MKPDLLLLIFTILVALTFDFLNGFHDAANSIATVVSTRVLSPKLAVLWAAFFNFLAAFFLGTAVATATTTGAHCRCKRHSTRKVQKPATSRFCTLRAQWRRAIDSIFGLP